ncbi:restriction endonuclease subunit S [Methanococcus voltae]|uniref:Restriction modification system DNA specificity subunit n=1 Tax=Methanococcus voltae (strain ATCC BAA-1334 / A3) TaxID=456320 RepID=D7DSR5_METV3|nr:restriction endonuclease subunit S [Methanococcus voltae]MCS3901776.1 type I restriction enzyme S subunit [Methanococcus voltae]
MNELKYRKAEELKDSGVEWIGQIPKDWDIIKGKNIFYNKKVNNRGILKNVLSLTLNGVIDRDPMSNEGLQPKDFKGYQEFEKNNLVFKLIDLENINTSRVGITHKSGLMSPAYIRIINKYQICVKYYYYTYYSYYLKKIYNNLGNSGVRSAMNSCDLLNLEVLQTFEKEQEKIANFLDIKTEEIENIISKKEKLINKLEEAKKSLISEVVTGKFKIIDVKLIKREKEELKDSGVEWIGQIPNDWDVKKLKYEVSLRSIKGEYTKNLKYIGLEHIESSTGKYIKNSEELNIEGICNKFKKNDILFGKLRPYLAKCIIANFDGVCSSELLVLNTQRINNIFLKYVILNSKFINYINSSTYGAKMPRTNWDFVGNIKIPHPNMQEQETISNFLDTKTEEIDNLINNTKLQIEKLKEAKQSLISEAVTGKIDLREWEIIKKGGD